MGTFDSIWNTVTGAATSAAGTIINQTTGASNANTVPAGYVPTFKYERVPVDMMNYVWGAFIIFGSCGATFFYLSKR